MQQRCHYCRRVLEPATSLSRLSYTRDHVVPRAMGGHETVPCCRYCNHLKGDTHPDVWDVFMRDNPEWWTKPELQRMTLTQVMTAGVAWRRCSRRRRSPLAALYVRDSGLCFWCDRLTTMGADDPDSEALQTVAVPDRIDDGPFHLHNLVLACRRCQDMRAGRDFDVFLDVAAALFAEAEPLPAVESEPSISVEQLDLSRFPAWWVSAVLTAENVWR